jgi:hypothetical protein
MTKKYYLSVELAGEKIEREVSLLEFCKAERQAGFRPKLPSSDSRYMTTPATGGFSDGTITGSVKYFPESA